ncbi:chorismate--pyruvate lyase family protein [Pontibacter sp. JAM-7]|uniref:chorismate--pyruvate lyase family protein n=1 Tax=Pontibacter sp. JAM-7 TaxID=3366581 RepID=UPI003AF9A724
MAIPTALDHQRFDTRWTALRRAYALLAPHYWQGWLMDSSSLTQRLVRLSQGDFEVRVIRQQWGRPTRSEAQALGMRSRQVALIREVQLLGQGQPWVYARSLIPAKTLTGAQRRLRHLGNRSLGSLLFSTPGMRRGPLQICRIPMDDSPLWARRSVFYLQEKPLLVCEVFLTPLQQVN